MEFKSIITGINEKLKQFGYHKKGHMWYRENENIYQIFEVERSNYNKSFFIYIGIYIKELEVEKGKSEPLPKNIAWCHFSNDLTHLITDATEKGKFIREFTKFENISPSQLQSNLDQIFLIIEKYKIFELLTRMTTYEGITSFLQNYKMNYKVLHTQNYLPIDIMNFARKRLALFN